MTLRRGRRYRAAASGRGAVRAAGAFLISVVALGGCAKTTTVAASRKEPFKLEKLEGTDRKRVRLEPKAAERIGIRTAAVSEVPGADGGPARLRVPYGALLYDTKGGTSVYTVPQPLVFVRQPVAVASIDGDTVVLNDGPPAGTAVVTDGGSELTGIEFGVGK